MYKLRNGRGETLIETLVSLAIAAFSMLMFASMIAYTARITKIGRENNSGFTERNAFLEERPTNPNAQEARTMTEAGVTLAPGTVTIERDKEGESKLTLIDETVTCYVTQYGGEYVISYEKTTS